MTSYERIKALVEGRPADRIGVAGWAHLPLVDRNITDFTRGLINFVEYNQFDLVKVMYNAYFVATAYGAKVDYSKSASRWASEVLAYPIYHPEEYLKLKPLDIDKCSLKDNVEMTKRLVDHYHGVKPVIATVFSPMTSVLEITAVRKPESMKRMMEYSPKELHYALEIATETNRRFVEKLLEAGVDGIFYATQMSAYDVITKEQYLEFSRPYDLQLLESIQGKTWFNLLHIHRQSDLLFREHLDYPVQAINWESAADAPNTTSIRQARAMTDKILVGGIDQHHDFLTPDNDREAVKAVLKKRLATAMEECPDRRFIFAPGCSMQLHVHHYLFTLMKEVVDELYDSPGGERDSN